MEFAGFLGNAALKDRLSAAFDRGRTSHCYLLCGPAGSGKRTLAAIMAAALQCRSRSVPCGQCPQCRKVLGGNHPDVITVDDPDKKTVTVDRIREARSDAFIRPNEGNRKVYLIPRAQDMNEAAQNALLKVMEEPPPYGVFLLLTDNAEKLLPTVRSRCAELRLEPVPKSQALQWLAKKCPDVPSEDLQAAYLRSGGYLGQAFQILQGGLTLPQTEQFAAAFAAADRFALARLLCSMEKISREQMGSILRQWLQLITEALLCRSGVPGSRQAAALAAGRTAQALMNAANALEHARTCCEANVGVGHICGWLAVTL